MIVAEQKPLDEIRRMLDGFERVLVLGCGTCVTVCAAGGEKEVGILASTLRLADKVDGRERSFNEKSVTRQCEWEYLDAIADEMKASDAILSLACGVGVQAIAERFPSTVVLPGLNTLFYGLPVEQGIWAERCLGCGDCQLERTGGICPIARCAKSLQHGPCGGSAEGKCEISPDTDCAWQLIYDRLKALGMLDRMDVLRPPKDWGNSHAKGPRKVVREDLRITGRAEAQVN